MDVDAFSDVSNGSTISVGSAASGGSGRMPRPPSGGSKRPKSAQGRRSRLAKSPYTAQQVKGSTKPLPPKPAARNMWITAMRNGNATLSTENSPMKSWAGSRSSHGKQNKTGTRTRHFSDVVQIGDSKNKTHIRSASMSASEPLVSGGGVAYKPKEDYYDEIIELKKIINALKAENNIVNTKLRRVEGENVLKDRKMEDLLNPRKQPEDVRRTLTDKKGDTSAIVNSLKQKLHAVERTVKDKETELSQLKKEMKMTNIEELQIQSETYYQEVQRLQLALIERQQSLVREPFGSTSTPRNHSISKGKSSGFTLQQLTDENNHLRAENQGLKRDLLTAIENVSSGSKKVPLKVDYADMNRGQLLGRIHELEEQVQESDGKKALSRKESLTEDRQHGDEFRRKGSVSKASEVPGRIELKGTTSQKLAQLQEREAELLEEREKQRSVIERLKEDRAHYRSVADDLRVKLKTTEEELVRSSGDKSAGNERRKSTSSLTSVRRSSIKESSTTENNDEDMDRMLNDFQQQRAAKTLQRQWRGYKGRQGKETERQVQDEQNQAAMTLQKNWRKHKQTAKRLEGESHEEAVTEIQAALRGHVIRRKRLETLDGDLEMADADDAIISIQSALRAHSARTRHQEDSDNETVPRDRRTKGSSSHAQFNSEPGLYDDELGSSSDRSTGKRHPEPATSGQRRSSLTEPQELPAWGAPDPSHARVVTMVRKPEKLNNPALAPAEIAPSEHGSTAFAPVAREPVQLTSTARAPVELSSTARAPVELSSTARTPVELSSTARAPVELSSTARAPAELESAARASETGAQVEIPSTARAQIQQASTTRPPVELASTARAQVSTARAPVELTSTVRADDPSESDSDDDAVVIGRSARSKGETRTIGLDKKEKTRLDSGETTPVVKQRLKPAPEGRGGNVNEDEKDGSRRAVITAPRFSNISENSDEEDEVATSYSRAQTKTRTGGLRGLSNKHENDQRKKRNTFEIVDSDDDDDDDDDDEDAVISRPRRSLDTGRALDTGRGFDTGRGLDTGISPQRPSLSRSNRALDSSGSSSTEATTKSPVSRPGLSRSSGRLNPSKDQEVLESSRDEGPQRPGLRSKRPVSAQRPSLTRKDKNSNGLKSTETSSTGWSRTSAGSDEDSDEDGVIVTGKKTKTAGGDGKAARPSLTRKSPAKTTPSKGGSIVNSLDNFFSSSGSSKGSTDNKSSRRRRSLLADSDDDDDDIVVSSRTKTKSKVGGKTSQLGRKDSAADLWATSDKGGGSSSKRKLSSDNSLKTSLKSTSRKTWGQEFEFEGPSRRPDSQLDELF